MRRWFRGAAEWRVRTEPADIIEMLCAEELDSDGYDTPTDYRAGLNRVAERALWCLDQFPADMEVRSAERQYQSGVVVIERWRVRYQARIDLVVRHDDGEVEHVDFKWGQPRPVSWIQRGVERITVAGSADVDLPTRLRTTTLYAGSRLVDSACLSPAAETANTADIRDLTREMLATVSPRPRPSGLCRFCQFRGHGCSAGHAGSGGISATPHLHDPRGAD